LPEEGQSPGVVVKQEVPEEGQSSGAAAATVAVEVAAPREEIVAKVDKAFAALPLLRRHLEASHLPVPGTFHRPPLITRKIRCFSPLRSHR
jgi:hypothetical protein